MNTVEVCFTPELIHQYDLKGKIVVAVDIFRATSCMVTGIAHGVESIHPVARVDECFSLGKEGKVMAGERGGIKVEGFDIGNSPFEYMQEEFIGKSIAVSTTNGTKTILASTDAEQVLIGAFLNLDAIGNYLSTEGKDVVIHCAGWKGTVNLEDSLFAGALIEQLSATHKLSGDSALIAHQLYLANQNELLAIARKSAHAQRLSGFGVEKDIEFCLQLNEYNVIPGYANKKITKIS